MTDTNFAVDLKYGPAATFACFVTATEALGNLCQERGYGPWFEEMREMLKTGTKGAIHSA